MQPAARVADRHDCPKEGHNDGKIQQGAGGVMINNLPAARTGDAIQCADGSQHVISTGSDCVFIEGKAAARQEDQSEHGGKITSGSGNVFIGSGGNTKVRIGPGVKIGGNGNTVRIGGATLAVSSPLSGQRAMVTDKPEEPVDIELFYHQHDNKPVAQAHYTVVFETGEKRQGQLDSQGHAKLSRVPKSGYTVNYSTLKAEDTEPDALAKIDTQLDVMHQRLAHYLDQLLLEAKQHGDAEQQLFDHESVINKSFILTGAILTDGWQIFKESVLGLYDLIKTGAKLLYDFEFIATGDPRDPAVQQKVVEYVVKTHQAAEEIKVDAKNFWWATTDPEVRQLLVNFAIKYWRSLSIVSKVKETGYAPMFVLMVLITKRFALPALRGVALDSTTIVLVRIAELQERRHAILQEAQVAAKDLRSVQYLKKIWFLPPGYISEFHPGASALMPIKPMKLTL